MDFYKIKERSTKNGVIEVYPDFTVGRSRDLMVRAKSFYAIWDEAAGFWSTDEYDVQKLVDKTLLAYCDERSKSHDGVVRARLMGDYSSGSWVSFRNFMNHLSDNSVQLDTELTFLNTEVKREDHRSKRLPYPLEGGDLSAYETLISTLYDPPERAKLEWAIGALVAGDARKIQKFLVLYGAAGTGKSTVLNILQQLFVGYYTTFEAKALTGNSNAFSTEMFRNNPLVAIQHDGDLSKIEDNTKLNSIISHEEMTMNEKFKPSYTSRIDAFLFMGTNKPVKITDAKSGVIRRLIDVKPSGRKIPATQYHKIVNQIGFELGAIAKHCLDVYKNMGKDYYSGYRPVEMMLQTDVFYNYIESYFPVFSEEDGVSLTRAYEMYKTYCDESNIQYKLAKYAFREELKNYFQDFHPVTRLEGKQVRSYYSGFLSGKFLVDEREEVYEETLEFNETSSTIDDILMDCPAQYASTHGRQTPVEKWANVTTTLKDLDTAKLHYVKPPVNHIVIDFDLTDKDGVKSREKNIEAASEWPATYSEFSKSGAGLHLHYNYTGDPEQLSRVFAPGIEIKVFVGDASLRRMFTTCNALPVATISGGLPLKEKKVLDVRQVQSENGLRNLIKRNLRKEIHPGTKPSIDFIHKILKDAAESGMPYDVSDLRNAVIAFASNSSNQALYCLKLVQQMQFASEEQREEKLYEDKRPLYYYDVEVFPNLFVLSYKQKGEGHKCVSLTNPIPSQVEEVVSLKLSGFNVRRYDNHILYAAVLGYNNEQLYQLSQKLISNSPNAYFSEAYNISWSDVYDYSSVKKSLKWFQINLGLKHHELGLPWDEPVPEHMIPKVIEYCESDVVTVEQVANSRSADLDARLILAELSGLAVNDTTNNHTTRIIFGNDRRPQSKFNYKDLSEEFPGYKYEFGVSTYRGEEVGEGGLVRATPGIYENVALLDVESMHPASIRAMNLFGPYTERFNDILDARLAIKHGDYEKARGMLSGKLAPYLEDESKAEGLAYALKIAINSVYGLTAASFDHPFKDPRNKDNVVAKRGALFMMDLKHFLEEKGWEVVHIKTDSAKIPSATPEIIEEIVAFGKRYGYDFDHEATYERFCLVNDAVYAAKVGWAKKASKIGTWETVGAQFIHPYVEKTLFTRERIVFDDYCETKQVKTALYLDFNEGEEEEDQTGVDHKQFVGRIGRFVPVLPGTGGGILLREKDGEFHSASGAKGYRWREAWLVEEMGLEDTIDTSYHRKLVDDARDKIAKFGDVEWFLD